MGALISAPLSMAATCGGSLLGSCCASMACKACSCACTLTQRVSSFVYLGLVYIFLIAAYTFKYQGGPIVIGGSTNATESSILDKMRHAAMDQTVGQISDRWNSNFWCAPRYPTGIIICCEDVCGGDFAVYRFSDLTSASPDFTLCDPSETGCSPSETSPNSSEPGCDPSEMGCNPSEMRCTPALMGPNRSQTGSDPSGMGRDGEGTPGTGY